MAASCQKTSYSSVFQRMVNCHSLIPEMINLFTDRSEKGGEMNSLQGVSEFRENQFRMQEVELLRLRQQVRLEQFTLMIN